MKTNLKLADAYYRLSVEEANGGESSSITNQRSIVRQYCEDNGITIVKEFVDATVIIGLKQNPTHGRRFSPVFFA